MTQTFSPTNYVTPSSVSSNIWYRNGHSISERHWDTQWTRESQFTDYDEGGKRFDISVTEASDYTAPVTNRISSCDFLGRTILTVTPMGTVSNAYDGAASRLISTTSSTPSTSSTTTYLYDDLGSQVGTLKYGITDASETRYETIGGEIWRLTTQSRTAGGVTGGVSVVRSHQNMEEIDEETWQPLRTSTRLGETVNYIYDEATYDASGQTKTQTDDLDNSTTNSLV